MEIFQTIWTALSTPNEGLINIFSIPLTFIEMTVTMLLFSQILCINSTKKSKFLYIFLISSISIILNLFFSKYYIVNIFLLPLLVILIFKVSILKSIVAEIISFFSIILIESVFLKTYLVIFHISAEIANSIPIYRISFTLIMYLIIYIIYLIVKKLNFSITLLENMDKKSKYILLTNFILGLITILTQNYLNSYYSNTLPFFIIILSTITIFSYFIISLYSLIKTNQLQLTTQNLQEAQLYNKSLKILHDDVRGFKHDFSNIVQAIGRIY